MSSHDRETIVSQSSDLGVYLCSAITLLKGEGYKIPPESEIDLAFGRAISRPDFPSSFMVQLPTVDGRSLRFYEIPNILQAACVSMIIYYDMSRNGYLTSLNKTTAKRFLRDIENRNYRKGIEILAEEVTKET